MKQNRQVLWGHRLSQAKDTSTDWWTFFPQRLWLLNNHAPWFPENEKIWLFTYTFFSSFLHKVCSNWLVDGGLRREKMCEFSALPSAWWDTSYIFLCKCQQQNMEMRGNLNIKSHSPVYPLLKPVTTHSQ